MSPKKLIHDEPHHIAIAQSIMHVGLIDTLKHPPSISAPGPLYSFVHLGLASLTGLKAPWIRFVNIAFFLGIVVLTVVIAQLLNLPSPVLIGSSLLAIPFIYHTVGIALTEIPALFFFTLFCLFFVKLIQDLPEVPLSAVLTLAILAGFSLGLAIIGRQTYICALAATPIILSRERRSWMAFILVLFAAGIASFWLFVIWGGLTPPGLRIGGINLKHGILSLAYLGMATCFICPGWMKLTRWSMAISLAVTGAILLFHFSFYPAVSLSQMLIPDWLFGYYRLLTSTAVIMIAAIWIYSLCWNGLKVGNDKKWRFLYFLAFLLALTPIGISFQFSSRYVVADLTVLVLILGATITEGYYTIVRFFLGNLLGIAFLTNYYLFYMQK